MTTTSTRHITEAAAERIADQMIWRRLAADSAYQNAMDANAQYTREEQISMEVWSELEQTYVID